MKNRTILAAVCIVLAIIMVFVVSPLVTRLTTDSTEVIRLSKNITRGTQITKDHLEVVEVKKDTIPDGIVNDANIIIGKYAATDLYAGDYLKREKLTQEANTADDVFADLNNKFAISVPLSSFAGQLSGKFQNGDVVRFYVTDENHEEMYTPGALQWVRIITTTTGGGIDQNDIVKNEDGSYTMPSTATVLVNEAQARLLAEISTNGSIHLSLVYRGPAEKANVYLEKQEEYFLQLDNGGLENPSDNPNNPNKDPFEGPNGNGDDIYVDFGDPDDWGDDWGDEDWGDEDDDEPAGGNNGGYEFPENEL